MWKLIVRLSLIGVIGFGGYAVYDYYRAGFNKLPEMPPGAFYISYKTGLRAILVDVPDEQETRRYLGYPLEVPFYLEDAWSFCSPPKEEEKDVADWWGNELDEPGMRLEAICRLEVEGETVLRGIIATVPKL